MKVGGKTDTAERLLKSFRHNRRKRFVANDRGEGGGGLIWDVGTSATMAGRVVDKHHSSPEPWKRSSGARKTFRELKNLSTSRAGVPVDVLPGEDLTTELAYGNHFSAGKFDEAL